MIYGVRLAVLAANSAVGAAPSAQSDPVSVPSEKAEKPIVIKAVLDQDDFKRLGIKYNELRTVAGWKVLSEKLYGTPKYEEELKKLNPDKTAPADDDNFVRNAYGLLSDKYKECVIIKILATTKLEEKQQPVSVQSNQPIKPPIQQIKRKVGLKSTDEPVVSEDRGKVAIVLTPLSAKIGTKGSLTIKVKGSFDAKGSPTVLISDESGVDIFTNEIEIGEDGRTITVPVSLENANPGKYAITVKVGDQVIGSASFTVKPAEE